LNCSQDASIARNTFGTGGGGWTWRIGGRPRSGFSDLGCAEPHRTGFLRKSRNAKSPTPVLSAHLQESGPTNALGPRNMVSPGSPPTRELPKRIHSGNRQIATLSVGKPGQSPATSATMPIHLPTLIIQGAIVPQPAPNQAASTSSSPPCIAPEATAKAAASSPDRAIRSGPQDSPEPLPCIQPSPRPYPARYA
jgi:hypothetical protein